MNRNVRKITDGAMMAAIVGVMLVINRQFAGLLEDLLLFAFPLPMVFYAAKYGAKQSFVLYAAILGLTFILSTPQTLFYVASEMLIGLIYGAGIHDRKPTGKIILITVLLSVVVTVITMFVAAGFFGYDIAGELQMYMDMMDQVSASTGMTFAMSDMKAFLLNIMIVSTILTGVMQGFVTHLISRIMLKRLRIYVEPIKPLIEYFPPKWSGYLGIACLVLYYASVYKPLDNVWANNIMQAVGICGMIYLAFFGYIAMTFILRYAVGFSKGLAIFVGILLFLMMSMPMAFLGFLYITTDHHRKMLYGEYSREGGNNA